MLKRKKKQPPLNPFPTGEIPEILGECLAIKKSLGALESKDSELSMMRNEKVEMTKTVKEMESGTLVSGWPSAESYSLARRTYEDRRFSAGFSVAKLEKETVELTGKLILDLESLLGKLPALAAGIVLAGRTEMKAAISPLIAGEEWGDINDGVQMTVSRMVQDTCLWDSEEYFAVNAFFQITWRCAAARELLDLSNARNFQDANLPCNAFCAQVGEILGRLASTLDRTQRMTTGGEA